jgi:hypothetical protein
MTHRAAVKVLFWLPVLHLRMEAESQVRIFRLRCNEQWEPKSIWYRYGQILKHEGITSPTGWDWQHDTKISKQQTIQNQILW